MKKIAGMLCGQKHLGERKIASIPEAKNRQLLREFAHLLKQVKLPVTGVRGFQFAQVTCGGIPVTELTEQMESDRVAGLYFAGELVDVDGMCGGYNLQWAWSSGAVAGRAAAEKYKNLENCMNKVIRVSQISVPLAHTKEEIFSEGMCAVADSDEKVQSMQIMKQSVDARKRMLSVIFIRCSWWWTSIRRFGRIMRMCRRSGR